MMSIWGVAKRPGSMLVSKGGLEGWRVVREGRLASEFCEGAGGGA
jgi:hypothetical protein